MIARLLLTALTLAVGSACDAVPEDNSPVCVPGAPSACFCPTGAPGDQVCTADGLDFEPCVCRPAAGAPEAGVEPVQGE